MVKLEEVGIEGSKKVTDIASLNPVYCFGFEKIAEVCKKFAEYGYRSFPIVEKSMKLIGIVTITDILDAYLKKEDFNQAIGNIMSRDVVFAEEKESIRFVLQKMKISKRGRLPILKEGKLVGMISETDFLKKSKDFSTFRKVKISQVMTKKPFFVLSKNTIHEIVRIMVNAKYRRLPVLENGKLVGYITSTRLFYHLFKNNFSEDFVKKEISSIMTRNPIVVNLDESLEEALLKMRENDISSILIVDGEKLEGIFTERDYLNLLE